MKGGRLGGRRKMKGRWEGGEGGGWREEREGAQPHRPEGGHRG